MTTSTKKHELINSLISFQSVYTTYNNYKPNKNVEKNKVLSSLFYKILNENVRTKYKIIPLYEDDKCIILKPDYNLNTCLLKNGENFYTKTSLLADSHIILIPNTVI